MLFNREYEAVMKKSPQLLEPGAIALAEGQVNIEDDGEHKKMRLTLNKLVPLDKATELYTSKITLNIDEKDATPEKLSGLMSMCARHKGPADVHIGIRLDSGECVFFNRHGLSVHAVPKVVDFLYEEFGKEAVAFRPIRERPQPRQRMEFYSD